MATDSKLSRHRSHRNSNSKMPHGASFCAGVQDTSRIDPLFASMMKQRFALEMCKQVPWRKRSAHPLGLCTFQDTRATGIEGHGEGSEVSCY
jgi:hypothetical protein